MALEQPNQNQVRRLFQPDLIHNFRLYLQEIQLLKEAHRMIDVKSDELALERFEAASKVNPEEIRADFYLGLLFVLVGRDPLDGEKRFSECVKRLESEPDRLVGTRRANYVAALNNLALTEVRTSKYDRAVRHWKEALEISPQTPELVQNLGRVTSLGYGNGAISKSAGRLAGELYAAASVANNSAEFDDKVGWLYMPFIDNLDGTMDSGGDNELRTVSWATCVAIAPDLVLTTTRALADADRFSLHSQTGKTTSQEGKLVAIDGRSNLAILRFEGLGAKPVKWTTSVQKKANDYRVYGFPQPGFGAFEMRPLKTTVIDVSLSRGWSSTVNRVFVGSVEREVVESGDNRRRTNTIGQVTSTSTTTDTTPVWRLVSHDLVANAGFIGSPLCDNTGRVIAIHLGSRARQSDAGPKLSLAEPSFEAIEFVQEIVPNISVDEAGSEVEESPLGGPPLEMKESVFQLAGLKIAPRLAWSHRIAALHKMKAEGGWTSFEDNSCMHCNGLGLVRCSNRGCRNGSVRVQRDVVLNRNPTTGEPVIGKQVVPVKCTVCNGKGKVDCPHCANGVAR